MSPDTNTDDGDSDDNGDGEKNWPDFLYPICRRSDEVGTQRQHESKFEYPGDQSFWWLQTSHLPLWHFITILRHGITGNNDITFNLIAPYIPAELSATCKELKIIWWGNPLDDFVYFFRFV